MRLTSECVVRRWLQKPGRRQSAVCSPTAAAGVDRSDNGLQETNCRGSTAMNLTAANPYFKMRARHVANYHEMCGIIIGGCRSQVAVKPPFVRRQLSWE